MIDSILDLLTKVPSPIPDNAIPFWDGCDWTLITMPPTGVQDCIGVEACIAAA